MELTSFNLFCPWRSSFSFSLPDKILHLIRPPLLTTPAINLSNHCEHKFSSPNKKKKEKKEDTGSAGIVIIQSGRAMALVIVSSLIILPKALGNSESDALYALRRSLSDPDNVLQSWDQNLVNPCIWFHITCNQDNNVTRVDLGNSNLSGHLVPELGKLEHLQHLELYKNNIQGSIPPELLNKFGSLQQQYIGKNTFSFREFEIS